MEEISSLKRQREETQVVEEQEEEIFKRQKSYKDIITLFEEEEDEPIEDLSSLISTLQEEISGSVRNDPVHTGSTLKEPDVSGSDHVLSGSGGEEVMRHLLEASDDELGIPNNDPVQSGSSSTEMDGFDALLGGQVDGGDLFLPVGEAGLWEFEDYEAANYYHDLLKSDIFV